MAPKKDLTKLALAALILASAAPIHAQADHIEQSGLFLAVSCAAHGCPAKTNPITDNVNSREAYHASESSYQNGSHSTGQSPGTPTGYPIGNQNPKGNNPDSSSMYHNPQKNPNGYNSEGKGNSRENLGENQARKNGEISSNQSYNSQRSGLTSPVYVEDYRSNTYDIRPTPTPTPEYGAMTNFNREYNTTTDYDYNRTSVTTVTSNATLTEAQLLGMLSSQGRAIYLSLDPEGKALAIQLASQDSYKDKNIAAKEAQRRMNQRRGLMNR